MLLLILLSLFVDDGKSFREVDIDDLAADFIPTLAAQGSETMFYTVYKSSSSPMPSVALYYVDARDMKLFQLSDGRFPSFGNVARLGSSFILYGRPKDKVIVLGTDHLFKEQTNFADLLRVHDADLCYISPYLKGGNLLTFFKDGQFVLGVFDGDKIDWRASMIADDDCSLFWAYADGKIFVVEPEKGKLSVAGGDFLPKVTLLQGWKLEPSSFGGLKVQGHNVPGLSFKKYFTSVIPHSYALGLTVIKFRDDDGEKLKPPASYRAYYNQHGRLKRSPNAMTVATNGKKSLVFLLRDKIFEVQ